MNRLINNSFKEHLESIGIDLESLHASHPLKFMIGKRDDRFYNIEYAFNLVNRFDEGWLKSLTNRLCHQIQCSSALSEIRAYGYLLGMLDPFDYKVEPILQCKTKKADFVVKGKDNKQKLIIEVAQKIVGDDKTENYKHFQHTVPYGFPDKNKNENVTANMVSKICATNN